jgi:glycosyltransferase involved in cell wall biosynthesis
MPQSGEVLLNSSLRVSADPSMSRASHQSPTPLGSDTGLTPFVHELPDRADSGGVEVPRKGDLGKRSEIPAVGRIAIVGTRGIPARYGGFETFAAQVAPLLVEKHGFEVTVIGDRTCASSRSMVGPVQSDCSSFSKSQNPLRFYWDSLAKAVEVADLVLICGTPGGGLAWRVRKKLIVVTNPDGLESRRNKWSKVVRWLFFGSEWAATRCSHAIACDSLAIESYYRERHKAGATFVAEYGALPNPFLADRRAELAQVLRRENLETRSYHLVVARIEPENQIREIIEGYSRVAGQLSSPILVVGDCTASQYGRDLIAGAPPGVSFLGPIYDTERLDALRAGALTYVHGHTVGGTNPSLLEAMAAGNLCICADNVFNRSTTDSQGLFFASSEGLGQHLQAAEEQLQAFDDFRSNVMERWCSNYTWDLIAEKYARMFSALLDRKVGTP